MGLAMVCVLVSEMKAIIGLQWTCTDDESCEFDGGHGGQREGERGARPRRRHGPGSFWFRTHAS